MLQLRKGGCDPLITDVIPPRMKAAVLAGRKDDVPRHSGVVHLRLCRRHVGAHGVDAEAAYLQKPFCPRRSSTRWLNSREPAPQGLIPPPCRLADYLAINVNRPESVRTEGRCGRSAPMATGRAMVVQR